MKSASPKGSVFYCERLTSRQRTPRYSRHGGVLYRADLLSTFQDRHIAETERGLLQARWHAYLIAPGSISTACDKSQIMCCYHFFRHAHAGILCARSREKGERFHPVSPAQVLQEVLSSPPHQAQPARFAIH
jgi:hypothetical protein